MPEIVLRLDEATARDLYEELCSVGQHIAAGAQIPQPSAQTSVRLARVMDELAGQLGIKTITQAMHESIQERELRQIQSEGDENPSSS